MALSPIRSRNAKKEERMAFEAPRAPSKFSPQRMHLKMRQKQGAFVLMVGDEGAVLSFIKQGSVVRRLFAPNAEPDQVAAMQELMRTNSNIPLYVLLDVIDQHYVRQTFPPVSSLGLEKMVKRRLDRDFSAEDMKGSIPLGRDKTGRKEWQFLLVSIAKTPVLQSWMDWFLELPNDCLGMFLLPQESKKLIEAMANAYAASTTLSRRVPWQLLLMQTKVGGYRQVVLRDGHLVFTRITQSSDEDSAQLAAGSVEQEIQNTIDYLRRLGFTENQDMSAYVVVADDVKAHVDMQRFGLGDAHVLSPHALATLLGYQNAAISGDRFADVLMSCAFLQGNTSTRIFSAYGQKLYKLVMARRAIKIAAVVAVLLCVWQTLNHAVTWVSSQGQHKELVDKSRRLDQELIKARDALGAYGKDTDVAIAITEIHKAFIVDAPVPRELFGQLSLLFNDSLRVKTIDWTLDIAALATQKSDPNVLPLELTLTVEFIDAFEDQEAYQNAVKAFTEKLEKALPRFTITSDAQKQNATGDTKLEITLDNPSSADVPIGSRVVQFKLQGLKPEQTSDITPLSTRRMV